MRDTRRVASTAIFSALIVSTNFALANLPDVKLDASIIFLVTLMFGPAVGGSVALISEFIWSQVSPYGASGAYLLPFLLSAQLLYVLAGWVARRALRGRADAPSMGVFFAGMMGFFTFAWDVWTNLGSALLYGMTSPAALLFFVFNPAQLQFSVVHELSNIVFGLSVVPSVLVLISRQPRLTEAVRSLGRSSEGGS